MDKKKEIFADGVDHLHFVGGVVRYDFVSLHLEEDGSETVSETFRVIMPPQGMVKLYDSLQNLIGKLVEAGILRKNEPVPEAIVTKPASKKTAAAKRTPKKKTE